MRRITCCETREAASTTVAKQRRLSVRSMRFLLTGPFQPNPALVASHACTTEVPNGVLVADRRYGYQEYPWSPISGSSGEFVGESVGVNPPVPHGSLAPDPRKTKKKTLLERKKKKKLSPSLQTGG